eukprot:12938286-Prorocentrum_lima.AAC.1
MNWVHPLPDWLEFRGEAGADVLPDLLNGHVPPRLCVSVEQMSGIALVRGRSGCTNRGRAAGAEHPCRFTLGVRSPAR